MHQKLVSAGYVKNMVLINCSSDDTRPCYVRPLLPLLQFSVSSTRSWLAQPAVVGKAGVFFQANETYEVKFENLNCSS